MRSSQESRRRSVGVNVGSRRRLGRSLARRHGLAVALLLAIVGGAGERPRGDGADAVVSATLPRPSRASVEEAAHCPAAWIAAGPVQPGAIVEALMAAPVCMVAAAAFGSAGPTAASLDP